jgi:hypothetical protein
VQCGNDRHLAELNLFERAMPQARMRYSLRNVAILQFRQIKTGREVFTLAREEHGMDTARQRREELLDANDGVVIERVAFLRAIEPQDCDRTFSLGDKGGRKPDCQPLFHHSTS